MFDAVLGASAIGRMAAAALAVLSVFFFAFLAACACAVPASAAPDCGPEALGISRVLQVGTQGGLEVGLKTYPRSLALADHEVVLTFDDGPLPGTTTRLLEALKAQCVRATFFMVGRMAASAPALARRVAEEGHTVAYHSFSHPLMGMIADGRARDDIDRGFKAVDEAVYGAAGAAPRTPFFRYPGFADAPALNAWLASRNIGIFGADLWAGDWWPMTPQAEAAATLARLEREKRGIILFHDTRAQTVAMMPEFLRQLKTRGFRIVHIVPGPGHAETREAGPGWSSETERVIAGIFGRGRTRRN
ncbi:Peptidoglycan/xylan/chitin deacetylase, PgdA/CDA1 family [Rhizobiales bacterium GAS113]|nr:Peptidoglycan/xylan/chitin deacetylase, PgdA/CDA1 family [Rhizobiales bacterium GAS113]